MNRWVARSVGVLAVPIVTVVGILAIQVTWAAQEGAQFNGSRPVAYGITDPTPPSAPRAVTAEWIDGAISVQWQEPEDAGSYRITHYRVESDPEGLTCLVEAVTKCTLTEGLVSVDYRFRVQALTGAGWGPYSEFSALATREEEPPAEPASIMVTGIRDGRLARVVGATVGLVGQSLSVRFKFPGQAAYTVGSAAPVVKADGTFGWQRRTGKKLYVYFETSEARSRVVTIQAR